MTHLTQTRMFIAVACCAMSTMALGCDDPKTGDGDDHADGHSHDHSAGTHSHEPQIEPIAGNDASPSAPGAYEWNLPKGFPRAPIVPEDNPMSNEKVELGRHLFYDNRLSDNETFSCASCHKQELAFTDGRAVGLGSTGESHTRGAMSLANIGYAMTLTWADPNATQLENQAATPIFGTAPIELGIKSEADVEERLRGVARYKELFGAAFAGESQPITMLNVRRALASFQRSLISGNSAFDRYYYYGEPTLNESELRGLDLVMSQSDTGEHRFECNHCHAGFNFSDQTTFVGNKSTAAPPFHQTGLYNEDGKGSYPEPNTGVFHTTHNGEDMGKFKAPTLRNIALTGPYMHDGSIARLEDVLDHYSKGGRARTAGKTDSLVRPFKITDQEKQDIVAFLRSLTDDEFITNPRFADPWPDAAQSSQDTN